MPFKLLLLALQFGVLGLAGTNCRIYVKPISVQTHAGLRPIRDRIVDRITASGKCTVVTRPELAGAVLSGYGWVGSLEGNSSLGGGGETVSNAVLEVVVQSAEGKLLWKERVTPRWFRLRSSRALADEAVRQLLSAREEWSRPRP